MPGDGLRFGDVAGSSGSGGAVDYLRQGFVVVIMVYVIAKAVEILFEVSIPLV